MGCVYLAVCKEYRQPRRPEVSQEIASCRVAFVNLLENLHIQAAHLSEGAGGFRNKALFAGRAPTYKLRVAGSHEWGVAALEVLFPGALNHIRAVWVAINIFRQ